MSSLVHLSGGARGLFARADWTFEAGRHWAVLGSDGAARSRLCALVAGLVPPPRGLSLEFADELDDAVQIVSFAQQRAAAAKGGFMQARYHSLVDDAGPGDTLEEFLAFERIFDVNPFEVGRALGPQRRAYRKAFARIVRLLNLTSLLDRDFLALSNGETRRALIARALLANPRLLVLDDPCAGLDPDRREQLKQVCDALAARGVSLLLSVRHEDEIPSCVTDVMTIEKGRMSCRSRASDFTSDAPAAKAAPARSVLPSATVAEIAHPPVYRGKVPPAVVELKDIRIAFGRRKLFDGFSWTVRQGEHWVLRGANGCGKTTLLSLVTGDNPKAYANDVTVFGHKRGGGGVELSRIRRRIGMVSPEMQAYSGAGALDLLEDALKGGPSLLLLDEPCLNLDAHDAVRLKRRVSSWLKAHPACAAICVAHREEDIPAGFPHVLSLSAANAPT